MKYRRLGKTGLWISSLSYGSWVTFKNQVDIKKGVELMSHAYDHGVNFFDNAEVYGDGQSEKTMGEAISKLNWSRDTYCLSSKVFWGGALPTQRGLSRKHIFDACHAALKRLQVDYLDLFFCHRPDWSAPVDETVHAMSDLVRQGKVMYWGTSEWPAQRITQAHLVAQRDRAVAPCVEQSQYNMFHRDRLESEYLDLYSDFGMGTTVWSPLASGILTGKYNQGIPKNSRATFENLKWLRDRISSEEGIQQIEKVKQLTEISKELDIKVSQLALIWCLSNRNVSTVILGASKVSQLEENLDSLEHMSKLDLSTLQKIEGILQNKPQARQSFL